MKALSTMVVLCCIALFAYAANVDFENNSSYTVGTVTVHYTDLTSENINVGAPGTYSLNTAGRTISHVVINGSTCGAGTTGGPISLSGSGEIYYNFTSTDKFVIDDDIDW